MVKLSSERVLLPVFFCLSHLHDAVLCDRCRTELFVLGFDYLLLPPPGFQLQACSYVPALVVYCVTAFLPSQPGVDVILNCSALLGVLRLVVVFYDAGALVPSGAS